MKKWICIALLVFLAGIGFLVYRYASMGVEVAEKFKGKDGYDNVMFNLEKALKLSLKKNGDMSEGTAKIYRMLGSEEKDLNKASEYFESAYLIYEIENLMDESVDTLYEKGVMWIKGIPETSEKMEDTFQNLCCL